MDGAISRTAFNGAAPAGTPLTHPIAFSNQMRSRSPEIDAEIDADIVMRIRHGQREAFDDLYDRYADDVFSVCLLILGEPTVAHAAAGTAFALVARSRLSPLSDPTRLHSWLLELARGSSLAWSGSPQVQAAPVPHGVTPQEMLAATPMVAAPTTLREGLSRTFDRAAATAAAATARNGASGPGRPPADAGTADGNRTLVVGTVAGRDARPGQPDVPTVMPLVRGLPGGRSPSGSQRWRNRSIATAVGSLVIAAIGVAVAINWPTVASDTNAHRPGTVVITPGSSGEPETSPVGPSPVSGSSTTIDSTVAGGSTQQSSTQRTEPATSDLGLPDEVALVSSQLSLAETVPPADAVNSPAPPVHASPGTTTTPPQPVVTTTPPEQPAPTATSGPTAPTTPSGSPGTQPPAGSPPTPRGTSTTNPSISTTSANAPALGTTEDEGAPSAKLTTVSGSLRSL
ncbi:RNA polymerase sigma factor [Protofrankia symbiont of Coriaria ruscifolia]|uniref:RNA polymerase sigma factor n=1 Tax=Protofrankia symbiont of Coriaria ruscifolia TaxID=1306542 RepID=UPI001A94297D|nr:RNA polymerase subunit sigma-24 [Protofrankia symbiont of Coriaria ruscifolia]